VRASLVSEYTAEGWEAIGRNMRGLPSYWDVGENDTVMAGKVPDSKDGSMFHHPENVKKRSAK